MRRGAAAQQKKRKLPPSPKAPLSFVAVNQPSPEKQPQAAAAPALVIEDQFKAPDPIVVNDYWVMHPVPQKALFRDILFLPPLEPVPDPLPGGPPPEPPTVPVDELDRRADCEHHISRVSATLMDLRGQLARTAADDDESEEALQAKIDACETELQKLESERQSSIFAESQRHYEWERERKQAQQPVVDHLKRENERKAAILGQVQNRLTTVKRGINAVQKAVIEVELEKVATTSSKRSGSSSKEDDSRRTRTLGTAFKTLEHSSALKAKITQTQALIRSLARPLKRHVVTDKNKYVKSGSFTKEKRAERTKNARPYKRTGAHINDYQRPRFPEQRDRQLAERAAKLGVPESMLHSALVAPP